MREENGMDHFEERNRGYWNQRSHAYSSLRRKELSGPDRKAWETFLMERLPKGRPLHVLDAGTGPAFLAIILSLSGCTVTALDFSSDMLKEAAVNAEREGAAISFVQGDVMNLPFPDDTFDAIVTRNVTWNLPDVPKAYASWLRVLKKGGVLLNMDTDYGPMDFTVTSRLAKNAHHGVEGSLIQLCQELKDSVRISTHRRPAWDVERLLSLGFSEVTLEKDIRPLVHLSKEWDYDPAPLFCIRAVKDRN